MKILHVSTTSQLGGAGIAAYRLHKGLRMIGADSMMLVNNHRQQEEKIYDPSTSLDKVLSRLTPYLDRIPSRFSTQQYDRLSSSWVPDRLLNRISQHTPDILNLHWVNDGYMRIETLPKLNQPVVWTLHDMWAFAGGEHYVGKSQRYVRGYNSNNRPVAENGLDVNRWIWKRKRRAWGNLSNLVIATPSKWLADCANNSVLFHDFRIEVLPNGVDHEIFSPVDHGIVRKILKFPLDKKLILFGAGSATSDLRKGYHLLTKALKKIGSLANTDDFELLVFGSLSGDDSFAMKPRYLGNLHDELSMALVYAAADVFVAPSLEDNLPNTVLESLSCGTPVIAFDIGGMPDMINHHQNGFLAPGYNTSELATGILWATENMTRWHKLSKNARQTVEENFTLKHCATRYQQLYNDIING